MNRSLSASRPARLGAGLALALVLALTSVLAIPALSTARGHAPSSSHNRLSAHVGMDTLPEYTPKAVAFHDAMRALWETHGTFTERAIVDAVGGLPETTLVIAHLQRNQVAIGDAIKPYYGAKAGAELTDLLHTHISDAVAAVVAAKSGDGAATDSAVAAFDANGSQIARFLHTANPKYWPLPAMQAMMRTHLNQVVGLAIDQIKGNYEAALGLYGAYIDHILVGMADMLSNGIIRQFPAKFR